MSDNIFFVSFSEVSGERLDPSYYLPKYDILEKKLEKSNCTIKKLKDICEISRGGSPRPIQKFLTNDKDGVNWIKIGDTKDINKYIYKTKEKIKPEGVKHSRLVESGDFILSNSMSFGRPYIMRTTGCIHDGWLLLRKKDNSITEDYLYTVLSSSFIYEFFKRATIGGVVENLSIDLVKEIKIPIPSLNVQKDITDKIDSAINQKEAKEKEAKEKLKSIDDYLLHELGIEGVKKDNSLENRIFTKRFSEVVGDRLDPSYYLSKYDILEEILEKSNFTIKKLKDICEISRGGSPRPIHKFLTDKEDGINWIKIGDTKGVNKYIYKTKEKIKPEGIKHSRLVESGDFILSNSMSFGKPYIVRTTGCIHDGWLLLRKKDNSITEDYLYAVLGLDFIYEFFKRSTIGGVVENLSIDLVKEIKIPLPPIENQNEITQHIQNIREEAQRLEKEAEKIYDDTKAEVEKMILGEKCG